MIDTPVEQHGPYLVKRDDLFEVPGSDAGCGGKVRTCDVLIRRARDQGARGVITAGSRHSPQVNIVAALARHYGLECRVHVPAGAATPEVTAAEGHGAHVVRHRPGYNSVITSRAAAEAVDYGARWHLIPFGMECETAVGFTGDQVATLIRHRHHIDRIVVPVGSGMTAAGILHGLDDYLLNVPVLGIQVGADPRNRLHRYGPLMWPLGIDLQPAHERYDQPAAYDGLGDLRLDSVYEAKCLPFLQPGDLLWVVGIRATERGLPPERPWPGLAAALADMRADERY